MTLLYFIFGAGLLALIVLISHGVNRKAYTALGLSLGVIVASILLSVAAYKIQMSYDHMHMTRILEKTSEAIHAGKAREVAEAYDRFSAMRTNAGVTFWDARNQLYRDLATIGGTTN